MLLPKKKKKKKKTIGLDEANSWIFTHTHTHTHTHLFLLTKMIMQSISHRRKLLLSHTIVVSDWEFYSISSRDFVRDCACSI